MLDAIAERYFGINCAIFTPNDGRVADIVSMARDLHADGIIDCSLQFCTCYEMESFAVEKAAEEAGIPCMHITTDYANEDAGQLTTRIEAFLEMSYLFLARGPLDFRSSPELNGTHACRYSMPLGSGGYRISGGPLS